MVALPNVRKDPVQFGARQFYTAYGITICSDIELPIPPVAALTDVDCEFRWAAPASSCRKPLTEPLSGSRCFCEHHGGEWITQVFREGEDGWFWYEAVGACHVSADGRIVTVAPIEDCDLKALGLFLLGQVLAFVLHRLGCPSLHASAVVTPHGGVAFVGDSGHGKSTLAGAFLSAGYKLLTDDVLPIRSVGGAILAGPGVPFMKLWDKTAERIVPRADQLPNATRTSPKRLLRLKPGLDLSSIGVTLAAVYVLQRYDPEVEQRSDTVIQSLDPTHSLLSLIRHSSNRAYLQPKENALLLQVMGLLQRTTPVKLLSYPSGFRYQADVVERLAQDSRRR